jgi:uracil phosphoribosyltransferase
MEAQKRDLNEGVTREVVLKDGLCRVVDQTEDIRRAFAALRKGYPDRPTAEQTSGIDFRTAAVPILAALARSTLDIALSADRIVLLMPWRSGLAFGPAYRQAGVERFYHLSSRRDEETLRTVVDYELGAAGPEDVVVIADPMLATGNTLLDAIARVRQHGVRTSNIIVNAVLAAPIGVAKIRRAYPDVRVVVGALDEGLDHRGFIVPGLGDFGDKYFAGFSDEEKRALIAVFRLPPEAEARLLGRFDSHSP